MNSRCPKCKKEIEWEYLQFTEEAGDWKPRYVGWCGCDTSKATHMRRLINLDVYLYELKDKGADHFGDIEIYHIIHYLKEVCNNVVNDPNLTKDVSDLSFRNDYKLAAMYLDMAMEKIL